MNYIRLEQWSLFFGCLQGDVYGHKDIEDGVGIVTAQVCPNQVYIKGSVVSTVNGNDFLLGEPLEIR